MFAMLKVEVTLMSSHWRPSGTDLSSLGKPLTDFKEKNLEKTQMPVFEQTPLGMEEIQSHAMLLIQ